MTVEARWFDGRSAVAHAATATLLGEMLVVRGTSVSRDINICDAVIRDPVGSGDWIVEFEDGARVTFADAAFGQELLGLRGNRGLAGRFERSWAWAVVAVCAVVLGSWFTVEVIVPNAARSLAFSLPPGVEKTIGEEGFELMDKALFEPSTLDAETQARIHALFDAIVASDPSYADYRLYFRESEEIGANAFAIPGGIVVITDALVKLAETDDELVSVLAHEVGHLAERHSMRVLLQSSAIALFFATVTGDITSVTALAGALPTVLLDAKYSRDFEREADNFAFAYIESVGMDPNALSTLLMRITAGDGEMVLIPEWFSTHPQSEDRVPEQPE